MDLSVNNLRQGRYEPRLAAAVALALATAALAGIASSSLSSISFTGRQTGILTGVALVILAGAPAVVRLRRDGLDAAGLYGLVSILYLGVASLAWLAATPPREAGPGLSQTDIAAALRIVAVGLLAFSVGSSVWGKSRVRELCRVTHDLLPGRTALLVAYGIGLGGVVLGIAVGGYGYTNSIESSASLLAFNQLFPTLASLSGVTILATAVAVFGGGLPRARLALIAMTVVQMMVGFITGFKANTLEPLLFVVLAYAACRGRFPWRAAVVGILFTFLFVIPVNSLYRQAVRDGGQAQATALSSALAAGPKFRPSHALTDAYQYAFTRYRLIDSVALIQKDTPNPFAYGNGSKYFLLPAMIVVPRPLWPSKPELNEASTFIHTYYGLPAEVNSATGLTQIGDLYRNFGRRGVLAGMLLWGLVIGLLGKLSHRSRSPRATLVYVYALVHYVTYVESDLPLFVATAAKTLPFIALFAWLLLPGKTSPPGYQRVLSEFGLGPLNNGPVILSGRVSTEPAPNGAAWPAPKGAGAAAPRNGYPARKEAAGDPPAARASSPGRQSPRFAGRPRIAKLRDRLRDASQRKLR
jgi:hypothetical protein